MKQLSKRCSRNNEEQLKIVSLLLNKKTVNFRFYLCIFATLILIGGVAQLSPIFLPFSFFLIFKLWQWYRKQQKQLNVCIEKWLLFFLKSNNLFQTETTEIYDKNGRTKKEKVISNSAVVGFLVREDKIIISKATALRKK